jgi:hypothetical protein
VNCGDNHRCFHGGTCVSNNDNGSAIVGCECPEGYGGEFCQNVVVVHAKEEEDEPTAVPSKEMSKGGKASLSLLLLLTAVICVAIYCKKVATIRIFQFARRLSIITIQRGPRITLPKVLQDNSTTFMLSYHDQDDHNDEDGNDCSSETSLRSLT